jgi:hypothetical protein
LVTLSNEFDLVWKKIFGFASDGTPALIDKNNGIQQNKKQNERI